MIKGHANSVIDHETKTRVGQAVVSTGLQLLLNDNVCRPAETTGFADHKISTIYPLNVYRAYASLHESVA